MGRPAHALTGLLVAALLGGPACSVTAPDRSMHRDLVDADDPIFDHRFAGMSPAELELSRFWSEMEPRTDGTPIAIHHRTFSDLASQVGDGVVNIYTLTLEERQARFGISPNELLPIRIPLISSVIDVLPWKVPIPFRTEGISLGSGFFLNDEGFVLTNAHVVHNATDIRVVRARDRREFPARIIGLDPLTDTALIRVEPDSNTRALPLGDSDALSVGEMVVAVGNPLGLNHTVTQGLVSATERVVPGGANQFLDFIQTDSAINPGSSGGPLLNIHGEVVGLVTAIASGAQLIGFAIPINTVKEVMPLLILGRPERGWLGAAVRPLRMGEGKQLGWSSDAGVYVEEVLDAGPAAAAGLKARDIIVALDGRRVDKFLRFRRQMLGLLPGQELDLTLFREGEELSIRPRLGEIPES